MKTNKIREILRALFCIENKRRFHMQEKKDGKDCYYYFYPPSSKKEAWTVKQEDTSLNFTMTTGDVKKHTMISIAGLAISRGAYVSYYDNTSKMSINLLYIIGYLKLFKKVFEK